MAVDFGFHPETTFIAVNLFDRYLSTMRVSQKKQQHHLALACLYLGAKIDEELLEPMCKDILQRASHYTITVPELKVA
jgi:hypothetical protein